MYTRDAVHLNSGRRPNAGVFLVLLALLVLPTLAVVDLAIDPRIAGVYALAISAVAYGVYAYDKARARANEWRISEATLHLFELMGGWPGAFVAQRRLRHKCSKRSYQLVFWAIVLLHQWLAFDSLHRWKYSSAVIQAFRA